MNETSSSYITQTTRSKHTYHTHCKQNIKEKEEHKNNRRSTEDVDQVKNLRGDHLQTQQSYNIIIIIQTVYHHEDI